jgi:hypothetical protein
LVLLISLTALLLSFLGNKLMLKLFKENAVIYGAPVFEELLKTIPAYLLNRSIFHVHLLFGLGEGIYDFFTGKRDTGKWAALVSIISHSLLGAITYLILNLTGQIFLALVSGIIVHSLYNYTIMRMGRN